MFNLCAGLVLFFSAHLYSALRSRKPGQDIKFKLGQATYMGGYSLISAVGFGLIIWGYNTAGSANLIYAGPVWARDICAFMMLPAFILMASAYLPLGNIKYILHHPMLIAVGLWAVAHLITGATTKQILLFGSFLVFCVVDLIAVSVRKAQEQPQSALPVWRNDIAAITLGCLAFAVTGFWLHEQLSGISPLG